MKRLKDRSPFILIILTCCFFVYIFVVEHYHYVKAEERLKEHALIIADDLWNYNYAGAEEYLKLAAQSDNYPKISIINNNGDLFQEIRLPAENSSEKILCQLGLIHKVSLVAIIEHKNNIIGWIEATWMPKTLTSHLAVLGFLIMLWLVFNLYLRLLHEKKHLKQRVRERTAQLLQINDYLKQEVSVRAKAESDLQLSEQKYRFLAENMGEVIWTLNEEKICTYMSPVSLSMYGWEHKKLEGGFLSEIFPPDSHKQFHDILDRTLQNGTLAPGPSESTVMEFFMQHRDSTSLWCEIALTFVGSESNRIESIMCVSRNVSERKQAETEHQKLHERVERLKKMESLGLLAGGVAHDLNNVLSGIVSYPELILLDLPDDSPIRSRIEILRKSGVKAAEIVQDLLALARRGVASFKPINTNDLIEDYLNSPECNQLLTYHQNIEIEHSLAEKLPTIRGSTVHLKKVIMNLISNAAEAQPDGGKILISTKTVTLHEPLEAYQQIPIGNYVLFSVKDEGEGIGKEELKHIFEPFYTRKVMGRSGTGLGLTVVWGTVEDHNGYIDIITHEERGTSINLYFPEIQGDETYEQNNSITRLHKGNGEKILLVDDDQRQREIASEILFRLNYETSTVTSGEEALSYLQKNEADLIILDMIMGEGIDGFETYKNIRAMNSKQKVIIASGYSPTERVEKAQQLGAGTYIQKPYSINELSQVIYQELRK